MTDDSASTAVSANEARARFADLLGRAQYGKERLVIRRRNRPVAALVPIEDLRLIEEIEDLEDLRDARAALAEAKRKGTRSLAQVVRRLRVKA
jgi:prevent-host-death family protein